MQLLFYKNDVGTRPTAAAHALEATSTERWRGLSLGHIIMSRLSIVLATLLWRVSRASSVTRLDWEPASSSTRVAQVSGEDMKAMLASLVPTAP